MASGRATSRTVASPHRTRWWSRTHPTPCGRPTISLVRRQRQNCRALTTQQYAWSARRATPSAPPFGAQWRSAKRYATRCRAARHLPTASGRATSRTAASPHRLRWWSRMHPTPCGRPTISLVRRQRQNCRALTTQQYAWSARRATPSAPPFGAQWRSAKRYATRCRAARHLPTASGRATSRTAASPHRLRWWRRMHPMPFGRPIIGLVRRQRHNRRGPTTPQNVSCAKKATQSARPTRAQ
mmetsp:Transcript_63237/g.160106  ORF Transcript_63237/g.160106 Transcript_63237/m.160106 type:complete len:241 (+) Transcript_63237:387-1109(+)